MKMGEVGIGLRLGAKDFRAIFIFHDHNMINKFIESGWEFGRHADAAAKASDKGGAVGGKILLDNISIYQLLPTQCHQLMISLRSYKKARVWQRFC